MLLAYLSRVKKPLFFSSLGTALLFISSFPGMFSLVLVSYVGLIFIGTKRVLFNLYTHLFGIPSRPSYTALILITASLTILAVFSFSHVFLFFNALPYALSATLLTATTFIVCFEYNLILFTPRNFEHRESYSLVSIMLSPRSSIARLAVLLHTNEHRAAQELELPIDNVPNAGKRLNTKTPGINELKRRSEAVFSKFPKEAIIDDAALYNKHLRALKNLKKKEEADLQKTAADNARKETDPQKTAADNAKKEADLQNTAAENAKKEARELTEAYQKKLTDVQKKKAYTEYREITQKLSLYGQCPVTLEEVYSSTPENFLIVEKRYTANHVVYSVPGRSEIYQSAGFRGVLNNKSEAEDPMDRDLFFSPKTYPNIKMPGDIGYKAFEGNSYPCHYVYYPYEQTNGHALSLQLCEAMEAFLDPTLSAAKQAALNKIKPTNPAPPTKQKPKQPPTTPNNTSTSTPRRSPREFSHLVSNSLFPAGENRVDPEVLQAALDAGLSLAELDVSRYVNRV